MVAGQAILASSGWVRDREFDTKFIVGIAAACACARETAGWAAMRTLVGRNLSTGGMLIEPHPDLAPGDCHPSAHAVHLCNATAEFYALGAGSNSRGRR